MTRKDVLTAQALRIVSANASYVLYPLGDEIRKAFLQVEREVWDTIIDRMETKFETKEDLREWAREQKEAL